MELCFLDTETGGLEADKHSLLSVGLEMWRDWTVNARAHYLVKHPVYRVTSVAMEMNKIDLGKQDMLGDTPANVWEKVKEFIATNAKEPTPVIVAGHNLNLDMNFLTQLAPKPELDKVFSHRFLDTSPVLRYLWVAGQLPRLEGLSAALAHFKIVNPSEHNALSDADVTRQLAEALFRLFGVTNV